MSEILSLEAKRSLIIRRACAPCCAGPSSKRCDCCMDRFAILELEAKIDAAYDAEAARRDPMPSF